jgi:hypothetical protein
MTASSYYFRKNLITGAVLMFCLIVLMVLGSKMGYYQNSVQAQLGGIKELASAGAGGISAVKNIIINLLIFVPVIIVALGGTYNVSLGRNPFFRLLLLPTMAVYAIAIFLDFRQATPINEKFKDIYSSLDHAIFIPFILCFAMLVIYMVVVIIKIDNAAAKIFGSITMVVSTCFYVMFGIYVIYLQVLSALGGSFGMKHFILYLVCFALDVTTFFLMLSLLMSFCAMGREELFRDKYVERKHRFKNMRRNERKFIKTLEAEKTQPGTEPEPEAEEIAAHEEYNDGVIAGEETAYVPEAPAEEVEAFAEVAGELIAESEEPGVWDKIPAEEISPETIKAPTEEFGASAEVEEGLWDKTPELENFPKEPGALIPESVEVVNEFAEVAAEVTKVAEDLRESSWNKTPVEENLTTTPKIPTAEFGVIAEEAEKLIPEAEESAPWDKNTLKEKLEISPVAEEFAELAKEAEVPEWGQEQRAESADEHGESVQREEIPVTEKSEQSTVSLETPTPWSETPLLEKSENPTAEPEPPVAELEKPIIEPEKLTWESVNPAEESENPTAEPEPPVTELEKPIIEPEKLTWIPVTLEVEQGVPAWKPGKIAREQEQEKLAAEPEKPVEEPINLEEKQETPAAELEPAARESEILAEEQEAPAEESKTLAEEPEESEPEVKKTSAKKASATPKVKQASRKKVAEKTKSESPVSKAKKTPAKKANAETKTESAIPEAKKSPVKKVGKKSKSESATPKTKKPPTKKVGEEAKTESAMPKAKKAPAPKKQAVKQNSRAQIPKTKSR